MPWPGSRSAYMPSKALRLFGEYGSRLAAARDTSGTVGALRRCGTVERVADIQGLVRESLRVGYNSLILCF
ncbi:hypothetical protein TSAR_005454 [Trichomalopsis sarcophagae]|uniref:Uncharacterized protein n=1 Tax=Trichomalopsis sarcophagae TaxID=543379 RepID=A0A232ER41_9HYME|nr:hypothetical protein TSAR_005454 [Trichomalopsis sarcophagae]